MIESKKRRECCFETLPAPLCYNSKSRESGKNVVAKGGPVDDFLKIRLDKYDEWIKDGKISGAG
jgi:hypothetical protein